MRFSLKNEQREMENGNGHFQTVIIERRLLVCPRCRRKVSALDFQRGGDTIPVYAVVCKDCKTIYLFPSENNNPDEETKSA